MQFFKSTLFVAVAFAATLVAASPAPAPASCPWQEYGQECTYDSDCACLNKCIASVSIWNVWKFELPTDDQL